MEIVNYEKKEMMPLTDDEKRKYEKYIYCHICKRNFCDNKNEKNKFKIDHDHYTGKFRGPAHSICNLRYRIQREISIAIHNGSTYGYHLIIKELVEEFKSDFNCLGENTEKYITFSVPIKKENKAGKTITYKIRFINSFRFMNTSLAKLTNNLSEINNKDCKKCMERNKTKLECQYIKYNKNKLICKCKKCDDITYKPISGLIETFPSAYQFCNKIS